MFVPVTHEIQVEDEAALRAYVKTIMPHFDYRSEDRPGWYPGIDDWPLEECVKAATKLSLDTDNKDPAFRHDPRLHAVGIYWPWEG